MTSRSVMLERIRKGLGQKSNDPERRAAVRERLEVRERHLLPQRVAGKTKDQLVKLFRGFLEAQSATVIEVESRQDLPSTIAEYLRSNNLPARIRVGGDAMLTQLPWGRESHLEVLLGKAQPGDEVGMTHAAVAVAETGTMVMASGADNPVTLNFMPETHVVVVEERDVVASYEDAFARLRERFGMNTMPRTVNFISGPSRTGDIGGRIVMGAHGPRRMCVVIVKEGASAPNAR